MTEPYPDSYYAATLADSRVRPPLEGTAEADVCVIGGGLAGISTALGLAGRGKKVVVLEGRRVGWGASGRNAGFVMSGFTKSPEKLIEAVGRDHARQLYRLTLQGKAVIRRRIKDHAIACAVADGQIEASWYPGTLDYDREYLAENFGENVEVWPREKVRDLCRTERYHDALYYPDSFHMHALNYLRGIANVFERLGGAVYESTMATGVEARDSGYAVKTARGSVRADHVVFCGSAYFNGLHKRVARAHIPVAAYMVATAPIPPEKLASAIRFPGSVCDSRLVSDFYRALPDGTIVWGGRVGLTRHVPRDFAALVKGDILRVYPQLEDSLSIRYSWPGLMAHTVHRMPHVRKLGEGLWACTHFGSYGLGTTTICGEVIAAAIAEGDETYKLFEPFGFPWAGGPLGPLAAQALYAAFRTRVALREWRREKKEAKE